MNLLRTLSGAALFCLTGAGLPSCINAPDYPIEPSVDFKDIQVVHIPRSNGQLAIDTLKFALNFRDGDGDLGLSQEDLAVAPFNTTTGGVNNRGYGHNYFIQPYLKTNGTYTAFVVPGSTAGEYDGYFPRLDGTDAKPAPLKGELRYKLPIALDEVVYKRGQVFRFEISIMDRALHQSNKIITSDVTLGQ